MALEEVSENPADRLFIVDYQDLSVVEECLVIESVHECLHSWIRDYAEGG
jgi:hypothetical protein